MCTKLYLSGNIGILMDREGKNSISKKPMILVILAGLIWISFAILYTIFENINRFSEPGKIVLSLGLVGAGVLFMLVGNLFFPPKGNNNFLLASGSMLSASGILGFILLCPDAWFHPKVAYIMLVYAAGILLLLSNIMLQQSRNTLAPIELKAENENIDRENIMFSGESQLSAAISSMMVSQVLNPVSEFSMWSSTCHENEIYECDTDIILDGTGKDKTCETEPSTESVPETMFPETMADFTLETRGTIEEPATTTDSIEKEVAAGKDVKNFLLMKRTDIKKDDHMREAAHKILKFHFGRMLKHEHGTMLGKDIEELHDMRVAAMRMRSVLQVFNGHLDMDVMKPFFRNIKATRKSLGAVRDLDVFMEKIEHYIESLPEQRMSEMDELIGILLIERDKARGLMLLHLDSSKYDKFKLRFTKALEKGGQWEESLMDSEGRPLPHRVRDVLPPLLYKQLAAVRAYDDLVHEAEPSYKMLHALRIDVKILRYTLEFFEEVLGEETKNLVKDLKALQDNLGDIHDAVVAMELLENYGKYGKWGSMEDRKSEKKHKISSESGIENYLAYRKNEITELLETFPEVWAKIMDPDFGMRFSGVVASLYKD
jgi:CHAD domain-containing protein